MLHDLQEHQTYVVASSARVGQQIITNFDGRRLELWMSFDWVWVGQRSRMQQLSFCFLRGLWVQLSTLAIATVSQG